MVKPMRQNEDKMGMGEIKENEATVNEITLENVEEQPVVYKEYSTEYGDKEAVQADGRGAGNL